MGEFSKIEEEFNELKDAHSQGIAGFEIVEMSDLLGAMSHYLWKKYWLGAPAIYFLCIVRGIFKLVTRKRKGRTLSNPAL